MRRYYGLADADFVVVSLFCAGWLGCSFLYYFVNRFSASLSYIYMLLYDESPENRSILAVFVIQLHD